MLMGYARVSKNDGQSTATQIAALKAAGSTKVFEELASGGRWDRPELQKALDQLRQGDVFIVWKLDRLSRSLKDLLYHGKNRGRRRRFSQPDRSHRYHHASRADDDADGGQFC